MSITDPRSVTLYGASDDLIEIDGAIREELSIFDVGRDDDVTTSVAFSDGTVLTIEYADNGVWRIEEIVRGSGEVTIEKAPPDDDDNYSDRATLVGDIRWVAFGWVVTR